MSLHAQLSPEAEARLHAQQRNATISSVIISILVVCLIGITLLWILLPPIDNFTPEIVSYQTGVDEPEKVKERTLNRVVEKKPSSPSSSLARVIASNTVSEIAIPVPTEITTIDSIDFGDGEDMGDGWGDEDWGGAGGATTFFGESIMGERILYVIDYSASMRGPREKLMRAELAKSVQQLPAGKKYQMIFFAGPAWVAGNEVQMGKGKGGAVVIGKGRHKYEWKKGQGFHRWEPDGERQQPIWLDATDKEIKKSEKIVKTNPLVWGTNWQNPLEMAFTMDPLPNAIIFMTDGLAGGNPLDVAETFASKAKKAGIVINAIALMEPRAAEAMGALAKGSGGKFSLINADGKKVDARKIEPKKGRAKKKK